MARRRITRHEQLRREAGYGTVRLADRLDFSHSYVSQIEAGTCPPSARYRRAFCELLGVSEDFAFGDIEQRGAS